MGVSYERQVRSMSPEAEKLLGDMVDRITKAEDDGMYMPEILAVIQFMTGQYCAIVSANEYPQCPHELMMINYTTGWQTMCQNPDMQGLLNPDEPHLIFSGVGGSA